MVDPSQPLGMSTDCGVARIPHCVALLGDVVRAKQLPLQDAIYACLGRSEAVSPVCPLPPACLNAATKNTRPIVSLPSEGVSNNFEHQTDTTTAGSAAKLLA
jgi:hypothetical protein